VIFRENTENTLLRKVGADVINTLRHIAGRFLHFSRDLPLSDLLRDTSYCECSRIVGQMLGYYHKLAQYRCKMSVLRSDNSKSRHSVQ
jgi:hypothetical protein